MLRLDNITLIAISSSKIELTNKAIDICLKECQFQNVLFFSDVKNEYHVPIEKLNSIKDYDKFVLKDLPGYLLKQESDFFLTIHWDGFIVNPNAWSEIFLTYDYIGAPWPHFKYLCGNGGFCLKSRKFLYTQQLINNISTNKPDDVTLCIDYRNHFLQHKCVYPDANMAFKFSTECCNYWKFNSFGFHDFKYNPQFKELIL